MYRDIILDKRWLLMASMSIAMLSGCEYDSVAIPTERGGNQANIYGEDHHWLRTRMSDNKCADERLDGSRNFYMYPCHNGDNQKFHFDNHQRLISKYSGGCVTPGSDNNLYVRECYELDSEHIEYQQFNKEDSLPFRLKSKKWPSYCVDNKMGSNNLYLHRCHSGENQKFVWTDDKGNTQGLWGDIKHWASR